ncbi:MAG: DUF3500 domain-containing protein [Bacteroidota bacterium]
MNYYTRLIFWGIGMLLIACTGKKATQTTKTASITTSREVMKAPPLEVFRGGGEKEAKALANPFVGISDDGKIEKGLFPIQASGVSTEPVRVAADRFLESLSKAEKSKTLYDIQDDEWRKWNNIHLYQRQGISFLEMSEHQAEYAWDLLEAGLSAKGIERSKKIMSLEGHIAWAKANYKEFGSRRYYITIMGNPSASDPWGWQLEGHHLIVNYFVLGDQVVMTPTFMGTEPVNATEGPYAGTSSFQEEESKGLAMIRALSPDLQVKAILSSEKSSNNNQTENFRDNAVVPYQGVSVADFSPKQQEQLLDLIHEYVGNMDEGHAKVKMEEVKAHLAATYFAWIGPISDEATFYYRIHSPVLLIEFDHQFPVAFRKSMPQEATREHIHTVIRTPNGNDYGKDLLRQHLESHDH